MNTERNLLAGILALQLNFIDRRQLLAAFDRWISDKSKALTGILESLGQLTTERRMLLEALVDEHLKLHDGDPQKSLAELTPIGPLREELAALADRDLEASLAHLSVSRGVDASGIGIHDLFRQARVREPASPGDDDPFRTAPRSAVESTTDFPRFRILRPHARGGLGEVYVARDEELHRDVALKEIQARHAANPASRQRFLLEAEITGGLEHPGIVPVYGLGTYADGRPYYAMRFIKGDNLKTAIEKFHGTKASGGREPPVQSTATDGDFTSLEFRKLLGRFIDVCNAIEYAHSRGVLHRDLKPGNIMLGKYGETLVVDWGLAKVVGRAEIGDSTAETTLRPQSAGDSAPTEMGSVVGTPHYMSPEQAEGRLDELGPASDVYSLGATLYTVLTGRPAFTGAQELEVLRCVVKGEFQSPRQVNRGVPRPLEAVCLKAMALKSAERYPSPRILADDVEHWLADEPVTALRETAGERLGRWGRKHRSWVRAGVAAALVVAAVSAAALVVVDRARRAEATQRRVAEARETQAIDAVKRFRDAVANEPELRNSPRLELLRKRLLKEPLAFFKELRERLQADNDTRPESLARLAQACFDLGVLTDEIGDKQDALVAYRESLAIRQKLADDNPTVTEFQGNLAASHNNIGNLLWNTGRPAEALAAHKLALATRQKLSDDNPTVTWLQIGLALSHNNIGVLLKETGKPSEALAAYDSALAIQQKLADDNPTVTKLQSELARTHNNMGVLLSENGEPAEALAAYQSALAIRQKLVDDNPTVAEFRSDLALSHDNIGRLLRDTGKPVEALAACETALAIRRKLADDNPTVTQYQSHLAASQKHIGILWSNTGKPAETLAAYEAALRIQQRLADDNPTVTEFRSELARSHNNIGFLLSNTGKPAEALAAYQSAIAIQRKLADDNPTLNQCQRDLALSLNNIGILLSNTGEPADALKAYESALLIRQKLNDDNPRVTEFQSDLAGSHNNIGILLSNTGKPTEALAAYESALAIRQKLADDNPTVTEFQSNLAVSHNNIGALFRTTGKPAEALAAYESALAIWQERVREHPDSPEFASSLGMTLYNLATLELDAKRFEEAHVRLRQAVEWQRKAVAANSANPTYRRFLTNDLKRLIVAARGLGDAERIAEAERELTQLCDSDPAFAALDARLAAVVQGDQQPASEAEALALAQRAYDRALHAMATRLWVEALDANPALADDRQTQRPYSAACCAALAASGQGRDAPPPDDAAKAKLRQQALSCLTAELAAWTRWLATADATQRALVARTLEHWQGDPDLAGIRDPDALTKLSGDERAELAELWSEVSNLRKLAGAARANESEP